MVEEGNWYQVISALMFFGTIVLLNVHSEQIDPVTHNVMVLVVSMIAFGFLGTWKEMEQ